MSDFIDIQPGQWVLAFNEHYGPHDRTMEEHLEMFVHRGGGWDSHRANEILHIYHVLKVSPKTYEISEPVAANYPAYANARQHRSLAVAAGDNLDAMRMLRDKFFAIGEDASDRIEHEMHRRIQKFAEREEAKALKKIHRCLPHIFGGAA